MEEQSESLAEVLGGSSAFHDAVKVETKQPEVVVETKPEPAPEAKTQVRDESGKFTSDKPEVAEAQGVKQEDQPAHVAAIIDERRKRQALERELADLRQKIPQEQPKPPPSIWEDEQGAIRHQVEAVAGPLRGVLIDQSVQLAKLVHKDEWQEAEAGFHEAIAANPDLLQQFRNAQNPGEFVYQAGVYHREMSKYGGSVVAMRDAIRGESATKLSEATGRIAALEKELADLKSSKAEVDSVPKSLNSRSSGVVSGETPVDPEDLQTITRFGKL